MDAGFSPLLTFDLEGRRSNLAGGGFKRFSVLRRRRLDFLATFLATSAVGSPGRGRSVVLNDWFGGHSEGRPR
jgi:hypothetical protein